MNELIPTIGRILKWSVKSISKFYGVILLISAIVSYGLTALWWANMLGESCRYDGSRVRNCDLLGMNVDPLSELFLTIWIMPFMGAIGGVLMPFIMAFMVTIYIWPFYIMAKLLIGAWRKYVQGRKSEHDDQ